MRQALIAIAFAAGWPMVAGAQTHDHAHGGAAKTEAPAKAAPATAPHPEKGYRSAFEDYRPFKGDVPAKGWREANEDVEKAGGHAGVMKGSRGAAEAHPGVK